MKTKIFMLCVCLLMLCSCSTTKPQTINVKYAWSEPIAGNKAVAYNAYLKVDNGDYKFVTTTKINECVIPCIVGRVNVVRVAGVDALEREGVMSQPSDPNVPYAGVSNVAPTEYIRW